MNRVHLIGRLTADPEVRTTAHGDPKATFRLAVPKMADRDTAVFVSVTCFGRIALVVADHLTKGRRVAVEGRLDQREWLDDTGTRHERYGVVAGGIDFLDSPDRSDDTSEPVSA